MVAVGVPLPPRIEPDAIVEAVLEIRFDSAAPLPEILVSRLAESPAWRAYTQKRLPAYEIPVTIRESDKNLRFAPIFELVGDEGRRLLRVGPHVVSVHQLAPYGGWGEFSPLMHQALDDLYLKSERLVVRRLGLRYINALSTESHGVSRLGDLDIHVTVSERDVGERLNLTFSKTQADGATSLVRVYTSDMAKIKTAPNASVVVDIDTATPEGYEAENKQAVIGWIERARSWKNVAFLSLLKAETLARLGRNP